MNYNYIIVEDNLGALENLQISLKSHKNFKEIGFAHTLTKGIALALTTKPHIIFLDVELGDENGFDLIKEIRQFTTEIPYIIMTTGIDKYAKKAVNTDVLYFIEKPIDPDELVIALNKFEKKFLDLQNHITIKNAEGHFFIQLDNIQYIKSEINYCTIHQVNYPSKLVSKTLKEIESILPSSFVRIHKSYIINSKFVQMLNTSKKKLKLMQSSNFDNNEKELELPIGDSYLELVKNVLLTAKIK
jgi:two-component system, LytTR family, response regulator